MISNRKEIKSGPCQKHAEKIDPQPKVLWNIEYRIRDPVPNEIIVENLLSPHQRLECKK